mmetsp:Transcript_31203/g.70221  ORF Transcript_31203/g.70221 Transcript_31203/m.70221 type:complete len:201 (+) Transcript_31203:1657-2259(+)
MVDLELLLDPSEDGDRVRDAGLSHVDHLEPPLQRPVALDVLPVLVVGRGADAADLSSGKRGLQQIGRVHLSLLVPGADEEVELVDEEDDFALRLLDLLQDVSHPLLKVPSERRVGHQRPEVEREQLALLQRACHVPIQDPLRQPLYDRCLPHPRLSNEHWVVLRPPAQDLHKPADFILPSYHGVKLSCPGLRDQILGVLL